MCRGVQGYVGLCRGCVGHTSDLLAIKGLLPLPVGQRCQVYIVRRTVKYAEYTVQCTLYTVDCMCTVYTICIYVKCAANRDGCCEQ